MKCTDLYTIETHGIGDVHHNTGTGSVSSFAQFVMTNASAEILVAGQAYTLGCVDS